MSRYVVMATWDDVPHLSPKAKREMLESYPPYQRDARSKGVPQLGAGAIYQVPEDDIKVPPFAIPPYWRKGYGFDVGWKVTAAPFFALDGDTDTLYLYDLHYRQQAEPSVHAAAMKAKGANWMQGAIDPASRGRGQADGQKLLLMYQEQGLNLVTADNAVETGILEVWERMTQGRFKVFAHLHKWWEEFRLYRRDEKGSIVKVNDHALDATRYFVKSGIPLMTVDPDYLAKMGKRPRMVSDYEPHEE